MSAMKFQLPDVELGILWRYFDGVSQALALRFEDGSPPHEENLTFLLCELLDGGTTGRHLLEYPLCKAKEDLDRADGGITLDVAFETHAHTKHVEHAYSGADLGIVFELKHPLFGHSKRAILLQAKRLFPNSSGDYTLNSTFSSFHKKQHDMLDEVRCRFSAWDSVFYLWYAPASKMFSEDDAKIIRSLEATTCNRHQSNWYRLKGLDPYIDEMIDFRGPWHDRLQTARMITPVDDSRLRAWRIAQPATRFSSLPIVNEITDDGRKLRLEHFYKAQSTQRRKSWGKIAFEPFANLFLFGIQSDGIGNSSEDWIRLARGEKIAMPSAKSADKEDEGRPDMPQTVPTPKHTLTFTLRSTLRWPESMRQSD